MQGLDSPFCSQYTWVKLPFRVASKEFLKWYSQISSLLLSNKSDVENSDVTVMTKIYLGAKSVALKKRHISIIQHYCNCVFLGNTENETYRLTTYKHFPKTVPINPAALSSCGFFYIGYKDRVKCYRYALLIYCLILLFTI